MYYCWCTTDSIQRKMLIYPVHSISTSEVRHQNLGFMRFRNVLSYNLEVYVGRDKNCKPEVNQGKRMVSGLCKDLTGRNVTCDIFFTSRELATELKKQQITLVGTVRKTRKEIPPILWNRYPSCTPNSSSTISCDQVSYVPKRSKHVTLLSTLHTKK